MSMLAMVACNETKENIPIKQPNKHHIKTQDYFTDSWLGEFLRKFNNALNPQFNGYRDCTEYKTSSRAKFNYNKILFIDKDRNYYITKNAYDCRIVLLDKDGKDLGKDTTGIRGKAYFHVFCREKSDLKNLTEELKQFGNIKSVTDTVPGSATMYYYPLDKPGAIDFLPKMDYEKWMGDHFFTVELKY